MSNQRMIQEQAPSPSGNIGARHSNNTLQSLTKVYQKQY